MRRRWMIIAALPLVVMTAIAQTEKAPTVDSILDAYVKAMGGKAAIEKATTQQGKGTFEMPTMGMKGSMETITKAPDKSLMKMDIPGFGAVQEGFDGTVAWSQNPAQGMREKSGPELAMTKRGAQFFRHLRLKELYPTIELKGVETVDGKEAYLLIATPPDGGPEKWYFDKQTSLLIRFELEMEGPMGKMQIVTDMQDYRETDGIKAPWLIKQQAGPMQVSIKIEEVKHNVPADDALFKKPSAP